MTCCCWVVMYFSNHKDCKNHDYKIASCVVCTWLKATSPINVIKGSGGWRPTSVLHWLCWNITVGGLCWIDTRVFWQHEVCCFHNAAHGCDTASFTDMHNNTHTHTCIYMCREYICTHLPSWNLCRKGALALKLVSLKTQMKSEEFMVFVSV